MAASALSSTSAVRDFSAQVSRASTTTARVSVSQPVVARRTVKQPTRGGSKYAPQPSSELYVEWGASTYDGNWEENVWPGGGWADNKSDEEIAKIAERELIHGRWAMLGCAGAWAGEVGTGLPWFQAGKVCTPEDCTHIVFPGQVIALAPEGSGYPSFWNVLGGTIIMMTLSEGYRTGKTPLEPLFEELTVGDLHPGGEHFDPLGLADRVDLDRMKVAELKHARLAMLSWLGYISQAVATNCDNPFGFGSISPAYIEGAKGPYANWQDHVNDPYVENVWKYWGLTPGGIAHF